MKTTKDEIGVKIGTLTVRLTAEEEKALAEVQGLLTHGYLGKPNRTKAVGAAILIARDTLMKAAAKRPA